ncbi:MAG: hypothetical protein AB1457_13660 [Chloroflexota bacterium]
MSASQPECVYCARSEQEVPLLSLRFQEIQFWICPQHLPVLIHQPERLRGKLPGVENLEPHEH